MILSSKWKILGKNKFSDILYYLISFGTLLEYMIHDLFLIVIFNLDDIIKMAFMPFQMVKNNNCIIDILNHISYIT